MSKLAQGDILTFFFTGLCAHLENKGILNNQDFAKHLQGMIDDERLNLSDDNKKELSGLINFFLPIRIVK